ncbi:MAG: Gfo/Idh/MocA family oxidoreductase, partial [Terricaulis silvestris]
MAFKLAIIGVGKIVRDQHIPAIQANGDFTLIATASPNATIDGVRAFKDVEAMLAAVPELDAVAICSPPQAHFGAAHKALAAGKHVLLEKPPCATMREFQLLVELAARNKRTLFQTWHSRYASGVAQAAAWLSTCQVTKGRIVWREDVRHWHPGQRWLWAPGGFGVFDPGINALSILTHVLPEPVFVTSASLETPSNQEAPIGAGLALATLSGTQIDVEFDFRETAVQNWFIEIETNDGALKLANGGADLSINGAPVAVPEGGEYPRLYARFAELLPTGASDTDGSPMQLVADAF